MTLPQTMTLIEITEPGGPEVLQPRDVPMPTVAAGEVLIRVHAAGVNRPDVIQRSGKYPMKPGMSPIPGLEVAGEVVAIGKGVSEFTVGDRVCALTNGGGYAEYAAVPAGQVLPVPEGWSFAAAAALPETWFTVTQTLVMRSGLEAGMTVLVHGASGGIGGAAIQIATILGARAIGVVSSPEKAAYAKSLGAFATIDYKTEDVAERVLALTDGNGVDRIVDLIGGPMAEANLKAAARGAHIVQVSALEGSANLNLRLIMAKQLTLSGSTLRPQTAATKAAIASRIRSDLLPALGRPDAIKPRVTTYPMADAPAAHRDMEARGHIGKIVLLTPFGSTG